MSEQMRRTVYVVFDLDTGLSNGELETLITKHLEKLLLPFDELAVQVFPRLMSIADMRKVYEGMKETISYVSSVKDFGKQISDLRDSVIGAKDAINTSCLRADKAIGSIKKVTADAIKDSVSETTAKEILRRVYGKITIVKQLREEIDALTKENEELKKQEVSW